MKRVVSVSLGSSTRNKITEAVFLGEQFSLERIGTDGDLDKAASLIQELDGKVDAIGLGGMDRYLWVEKKKYAIRQVDKLARKAVRTPVVDGSGLKNMLEPLILQSLASNKIIDFHGKRVLLLSGVDRYGMAKTLPQLGCQVTYGDLIFALGLPIPMHSLSAIRFAGTTLLPIICWLPMSFLYPIGSEQQKPPSPKHERWFKDKEIIAGDWHFLRRYMPQDLTGKIIITNTTTEEDMRLLTERGAKLLITTTPSISGRSFGTNVMEGVLASLTKRCPEQLTEADYADIIHRLDLQPSIEYLQQSDHIDASTVNK